MTLVSIKEYCKRKNITDAGVRKAINTNRLKSVSLDNITYIVLDESNEIEKLKQKIRLLNSKIRELKNKALLYTNQEEELKKKDDLISKLEDKLDKQIEKKEELYEKVISQFNIMLIENKKE